MTHEEKMGKAWEFINNLPFTEDEEKYAENPDHMILVESLHEVRDAFYEDLESNFNDEEDVYNFLNRHGINWK